jgi:hypothetical protein
LDLEATNEEIFHVKVYIALTKKRLSMNYNTNEILSHIKDEKEVRAYYVDQFGLYKLLEDRSYLENAYNNVQNAKTWIDEFKQKYLNYPVQKQIIELWEKENA